jgi:cardiolipin synthase A/B
MAEPPPQPSFTVAGNRLTMLDTGPRRLEGLLALIQGAERSLRILYYIYVDDAVGTRVRDAMIAAAARGVNVSLIVDGLGSEHAAQRHFFEPLAAAGVAVCRFVPRWGRRYLLRNHQKMAIADEARTIIGGFNVEDSYFGTPAEQAWRDLGLLVEGPAAARLAGYFDALSAWAKQPHAPLRGLRRELSTWSEPEGQARWLLGGPTRRLSPRALTVKHEIRRARRLAMIAAYFAPNPGLLRTIRRLARTGEVKIVTAAKSDNSTTVAAARHTYRRLLRRGARVFEYQPLKLHTKLFVIDDAGFVGSANCDMRSLYINLEVMLRVEDRAFADALRAHVESEIAASREATPERLKIYAGWWTRTRWSFAYFLVAVVDYTVTRRLNFKPGSAEIGG